MSFGALRNRVKASCERTASLIRSMKAKARNDVKKREATRRGDQADNASSRHESSRMGNYGVFCFRIGQK